MTVVGLLVVVVALTWYLIAGRSTGTLTSLERTFLAISPLPVILMFAVPLAIDALRPTPGAVGGWRSRIEPGSIWVSAALLLLGLGLTWARFARGADRQGRLVAGIFLAGIPVLLALLVGLLYSIGHHA